MSKNTPLLPFAAIAAVERLMRSDFEGDIFVQAVAECLNIKPELVTPEQRALVKEWSFATRYSGGIRRCAICLQPANHPAHDPAVPPGTPMRAAVADRGAAAHAYTPLTSAVESLECGGTERVLRKLQDLRQPVLATVGHVVVTHRAHELCHYCGTGNAHEATHCVACGCPLADPVQSTETPKET